MDRGQAPAQPLERPVAERRGEAAVGASGQDTPVGEARGMERVGERGHRRAALRRVKRHGGSPGSDRSLKAGALTDEGLEATGEGTPQGGPVSPLLANLRLDERDKEVERRGHRFVR